MISQPEKAPFLEAYNSVALLSPDTLPPQASTLYSKLSQHPLWGKNPAEFNRSRAEATGNILQQHSALLSEKDFKSLMQETAGSENSPGRAEVIHYLLSPLEKSTTAGRGQILAKDLRFMKRWESQFNLNNFRTVQNQLLEDVRKVIKDKRISHRYEQITRFNPKGYSGNVARTKALQERIDNPKTPEESKQKYQQELRALNGILKIEHAVAEAATSDLEILQTELLPPLGS